MDMCLDRELASSKVTLAEWYDKTNVTLDKIVPEPAGVSPFDVGTVNDKLTGVDIVYRDSVPYVRIRVPDILLNTLNKLGNNLGTSLFPTLDKAALSISDNRFETAKELDSFRKYIDLTLSVARTDAVNTDLNKLNDNLSNLLQKPLVQMVSKVIPHIVQAIVPMLHTAPSEQTADVLAKIVPIIEDGITKGTTCITDVSNYVTKAINTAEETAKFTCRSTGYIPSRRVLPGLVANIQTIADQAVEYAPICIDAISQQTLTKLAHLQKSLLQNTTSTTVPTPSGTSGEKSANGVTPTNNSSGSATHSTSSEASPSAEASTHGSTPDASSTSPSTAPSPAPAATPTAALKA